MSRVLIVDDEPSICWAFREFLGDLGHEVELASSAEEGLRIAQEWRPRCRRARRAPAGDGRPVGTGPVPRDRQPCADHRRSPPSATSTPPSGPWKEGLSITWSSPSTSIRPRRSSTVHSSRHGGRHAADLGEPSPTGEAGRGKTTGPAMVGRSPAMQQLFKQIALVAPTDAPVLITGESGTGKELVARAIHRHSTRRSGPYLPVCLAALSPGLIEAELFGHVRGSFTGATQDRKGLLELAERRDRAARRDRRRPSRRTGQAPASDRASRGHRRGRCPPQADRRPLPGRDQPAPRRP